MYPFDKPLSAITYPDLVRLCENRLAENDVLDFKQALSASDGEGDWQEFLRNDKDAKIKIAKELVAFANTSGGTLLLGVSEDKENRASGLMPINQAEMLKDRLVQILTEIIEPPIHYMESAAIPSDDPSKGVVIFRTEKSLDRPHRINMKRSNTTRHTEAYVRRGTNSEPMTMHEIQQLSVLRNHEIDVVKSRFAELLNELRSDPVKRPAEYKYTFLACPINPTTIKFSNENFYRMSDVTLCTNDDTKLAGLIDRNASWFQANRVLGGRSFRITFRGESFCRYWWMNDGSFRFHCNEVMKSDGQQRVNPEMLLAPLCYLAKWFLDLQSFQTSSIAPRMVCGFILDNSQNLPLGSFKDSFSSILGTPDYSPIKLSELYEFSGIGELEKLSEVLANDLFNAFNTEFRFGQMHFNNI